MNINSENNQGLPDEKELEKLANSFFKQVPNDISQAENPALQHSLPQQNLGGGLPELNTVMGLSPVKSMYGADIFNIAKTPKSLTGMGASPWSLQRGSNFNYQNPQTSLPDPNIKDGGVPVSLAGSGASPSLMTPVTDPAKLTHPEQLRFLPFGQLQPFEQLTKETLNAINAFLPHTQLPFDANTPVTEPSLTGIGVSPGGLEQGNKFNNQNPQTSLPDPNFKDGDVPVSVAGSGALPSLKSPVTDPAKSFGYLDRKNGGELAHLEQLRFLPFSQQQPFEQLTKEALNGINSYLPHAQLPYGANTPASEASFYFMEGKNYPAHDFSGNQTGQKIAPLKTHGISSVVQPPFDANQVKRDFPILQQRVNGRQLIWLDNAATTQKPKLVIDRLKHFYETENSNVHRAAHELAARATDAYESAREKVRQFLNASSVNEIVFVRGATEGINLVAKSWGEQNLKEGDEIILSHLEHHANIVPWQQLAAKNGLKLRVIPVDDTGQVMMDEYSKLLNAKTKLVAVSQVSNALGTITPVPQITAMAHAAGAKVLIDGAQSVSHMRTDVQAIDADWFVFSGHKIFAPTGIGVVYGKEALLNETEPWQGGGNMIADVTFEETKYQNAPLRFEAGTGSIADAVGLGAAIDYVTRLGIENIMQYEHYLLLYATALMKQVPGLTLIGTAAEKASVLSFVLEGYKTEQVGAYLNEHGIAVRSGHHCAQPILRRFGLESTVRPSLAFYNTCSDVDTLVSVLHQLASKKK